MNQQQPPWARPNTQALNSAQYRQSMINQQQQINRSRMPIRVNNNIAEGPMPRKYTAEEINQAKTVKGRIEEALRKDHEALKLNSSPFMSKNDVVERLLPFHVYQVIDIDHSKYDNLSTKQVVSNANTILEQGQRILETDTEDQKLFYVQFASSIVSNTKK